MSNSIMVSPGYFETMGIPRLAGRDFTNEAATAGPKAAIVNQAFAQRLFGSENPIGQCVDPEVALPIRSLGLWVTSKHALSVKDFALCSSALSIRQSPLTLPSWAIPYWFVPQ
jgi:hypothetical protein